MTSHTLEESTKQAFLSWYEPIHEPFIKYCGSKCFGKISKEDLVQETILATLISFHKIGDKNRLLKYMMVTANNKIKNQLRRTRFSAPWDEKTFALLEAKGVDPEMALDIKYLYDCIDQLSPAHKECILLFEISGFSIKEISEIQGVSQGAVKTRTHRARKELKKLMSAEHTVNKGAGSSLKNLIQAYSFILL